MPSELKAPSPHQPSSSPPSPGRRNENGSSSSASASSSSLKMEIGLSKDDHNDENINIPNNNATVNGSGQQSKSSSVVENSNKSKMSKHQYSLEFLYSLRHRAESTAPLEQGSQLCQLMKWSSLRRNFNEEKQLLQNHTGGPPSGGIIGTGNVNPFLNGGVSRTGGGGRLDISRFGSADETVLFDGMIGLSGLSGNHDEFQTGSAVTATATAASAQTNPGGTGGGSLLGHPTQFRSGPIGSTTPVVSPPFGTDVNNPAQPAVQQSVNSEDNFSASVKQQSSHGVDGLVVSPETGGLPSMASKHNNTTPLSTATATTRTGPAVANGRIRDFNKPGVGNAGNMAGNSVGNNAQAQWNHGGSRAGGKNNGAPRQPQPPQPLGVPSSAMIKGQTSVGTSVNVPSPPLRNSVATTAAANGGPFFASRFGNMSQERNNSGGPNSNGGGAHRSLFENMYRPRDNYVLNEGATVMNRQGNPMAANSASVLLPPHGPSNGGGTPGAWEQDLWDSPMEGIDTGDIFTLGDIRRAERMIESQGITADMYADLETRRILSDQQKMTAGVAKSSVNNNGRVSGSGTMSRANNNNNNAGGAGTSQDIFFGDDSLPGYGRETSPFSNHNRTNGGYGSSTNSGESRFISMFNKQTDNSHLPSGNGGGNGFAFRSDFNNNNNSASGGDYLNSSPTNHSFQQGGGPSPTSTTDLNNHHRAGVNMMISRNLNNHDNSDRVIDKATVREHLLRLIGGGNGGNLATSPPGSSPPSAMMVRDSEIVNNSHLHQTMGTSHHATGGMPPSTSAGGHLMRGPITFSKPMNPAAPNFAPSGLFHNYGNHSAPQSMDNGSRPIPPPPPTDFRRGMSGNVSEGNLAGTNNGGSLPNINPNWLRRELSNGSGGGSHQYLNMTGDQQTFENSNNTHHNLVDHAGLAEIGTNELYDLLQRWVARQQQQQQPQQQPQQQLQQQQQQQNSHPLAGAPGTMDPNMAVKALIQNHAAALAAHQAAQQQPSGPGMTKQSPPSDALLARYNSLIMHYLKRAKAAGNTGGVPPGGFPSGGSTTTTTATTTGGTTTTGNSTGAAAGAAAAGIGRSQLGAASQPQSQSQSHSSGGTAAPMSTAAIAQQVAAIQMLLQQQISRQQQSSQRAENANNGSAGCLPPPGGFGASQRQQLAFLLQTLQKLKSNQAMASGGAGSTAATEGTTQSVPNSRPQQPIFLSNALEQITSKHQAAMAAAAAAAGNVSGQPQQTAHPLQRPTGIKPSSTSSMKKSGSNRQGPSSSEVQSNFIGSPTTSFGPPPGIPSDMAAAAVAAGRMLHNQQQQHMNVAGGRMNLEQPPAPTSNVQTKSLDAARAQLSALLKDLVAQGGGSQALSVLLKKTPPGQAQAIQAQLQALIQQKTAMSAADGSIYRSSGNGSCGTNSSSLGVDGTEESSSPSVDMFMRLKGRQGSAVRGTSGVAAEDRENICDSDRQSANQHQQPSEDETIEFNNNKNGSAVGGSNKSSPRNSQPPSAGEEAGTTVGGKSVGNSNSSSRMEGDACGAQ